MRATLVRQLGEMPARPDPTKVKVVSREAKGDYPLDTHYESAMPFREGLAAVRSFAERVWSWVRDAPDGSRVRGAASPAVAPVGEAALDMEIEENASSLEADDLES